MPLVFVAILVVGTEAGLSQEIQESPAVRAVAAERDSALDLQPIAESLTRPATVGKDWKRGAKIGAIVGGAAGAALGFWLGYGLCDAAECNVFSDGYRAAIVFGGIGAGAGAAVGALIGAQGPD